MSLSCRENRRSGGANTCTLPDHVQISFQTLGKSAFSVISSCDGILGLWLVEARMSLQSTFIYPPVMRRRTLQRLYLSHNAFQHGGDTPPLMTGRQLSPDLHPRGVLGARTCSLPAEESLLSALSHKTSPSIPNESFSCHQLIHRTQDSARRQHTPPSKVRCCCLRHESYACRLAYHQQTQPLGCAIKNKQ